MTMGEDGNYSIGCFAVSDLPRIISKMKEILAKQEKSWILGVSYKNIWTLKVQEIF
jgi:hypothetical protein